MKNKSNNIFFINANNQIEETCYEGFVNQYGKQLVTTPSGVRHNDYLLYRASDGTIFTYESVADAYIAQMDDDENKSIEYVVMSYSHSGQFKPRQIGCFEKIEDAEKLIFSRMKINMLESCDTPATFETFRDAEDYLKENEIN